MFFFTHCFSGFLHIVKVLLRIMKKSNYIILTIADFISTMGDLAVKVFTDVLIVCYAEGLIDRKMFAVDGCKISANCSKEWSGTKGEL